MKQIITGTSVVFLCASSLANAGVEMNMVTRDASGTETDRTKIYAQAGRIRMEGGRDGAGEASMIFLGDSFMYIDHADQSYVVMDEAMLDQVSAKMNAAMKEMEAQLANMPPEQRAMVEEMMKGQMPGMMGQPADKPPPPRVESIGSGEWKSRDCEEYAVYEDGQKTQEICAAALDDVNGADEVIKAFRSMSAYMTKMTESMPMISADRTDPGKLMEQIDGFPVHTIEYANGEMVRDTSLDSVTEQDLDDALFAAPDGYSRKDPFAGR